MWSDVYLSQYLESNKKLKMVGFIIIIIIIIIIVGDLRIRRYITKSKELLILIRDWNI